MINIFVGKQNFCRQLEPELASFAFSFVLRIHLATVSVEKNNRKRGWQFCTNCGGGSGLKLAAWGSCDGAALELWGFGALGCLGGGRQNSSPG